VRVMFTTTLKEIEEWVLEDRLTKIMNQEVGKGKTEAW
jgi:hypothetical protein